MCGCVRAELETGEGGNIATNGRAGCVPLCSLLFGGEGGAGG